MIGNDADDALRDGGADAGNDDKHAHAHRIPPNQVVTAAQRCAVHARHEQTDAERANRHRNQRVAAHHDGKADGGSDCHDANHVLRRKACGEPCAGEPPDEQRAPQRRGKQLRGLRIRCTGVDEKGHEPAHNRRFKCEIAQQQHTANPKNALLQKSPVGFSCRFLHAKRIRSNLRAHAVQQRDDADRNRDAERHAPRRATHHHDERCRAGANGKKRLCQIEQAAVIVGHHAGDLIADVRGAALANAGQQHGKN